MTLNLTLTLRAALNPSMCEQERRKYVASRLILKQYFDSQLQHLKVHIRGVRGWYGQVSTADTYTSGVSITLGQKQVVLFQRVSHPTYAPHRPCKPICGTKRG